MGQPQDQPGDAHSGGCGCGGHTAGPEQGFNDYGAMFGHVSGMVNDFMNGRTPDAQKVMGMLESCSSQFWKGAAVGAGLGLLLSSNAVRDAISGMVGGVFGGKSSTTSTNE
ncbi:hypothetical protein DQK91_01195 [Oceanidesulfovibrio marinus]|uniref:Uncharacterized protein n=2 Tax=Oceanidesulfovibrio marinus TaxID=370038 RepID=A0A6P1ZKU6_9BACT|nr:hypothetical protein DQK91_01195 [Oceanidesulfovibrio marinus]